jgi:hypothetical protein
MHLSKKVIGLDFDNTIVNYDNSFRLLSDKFLNLPKNIIKKKETIKNYLLSEGKESDWTEFQGLIYGPGISYAQLYPESINTIIKLLHNNYSINIISHRSKFPYKGKKYDLHKYANKWLHLKFDKKILENIDISFLTTKEEKIKKIIDKNCNFFLDDLVSIISEINIYSDCRCILFDPENLNENKQINSISNWNELENEINRRY